jgi:hypothetical protein
MSRSTKHKPSGNIPAKQGQPPGIIDDSVSNLQASTSAKSTGCTIS